jgi:adenine phosphoribosyltransferase
MDRLELRSRLKHSFAWVGDAGTTSRGADRSGWTRDADIVQAIGPALRGLFSDHQPTVIFAPPSSGYLFGALVAQSLGVAFVGASKERRGLSDSDKWLAARTPLDYRGRNMELSFRARLIKGNDRVLVVDDWADTGGQLSAMAVLVEKSGARYVGSAVVVDGLIDHTIRRRLEVRSLLNLRDL